MKVFTVYEINRYIKSVLEDDVLLNGVFIEGEVSNYKRHTSGHLYFTLKDESAGLNCVMFKSAAAYLKFEPENGMKATVFGRISLYERTGAYQLYAEAMEPAGKGGLYMAYEQLKQKLEAEGLFDVSHKKELPAFSRRVAVITSPTGAAVRDIIQIARRRNPYVELFVYPVLVQGREAAADIAAALRAVNEWGLADVIILGRGGGSLEDLWPFNEELTARAIFASKIPVISAVGHETDYTVADFAADLRAPTPSAAAELAVYDFAAVAGAAGYLTKRLHTAIGEKLRQKREKCAALLGRRSLRLPLDAVRNRSLYLGELIKRLEREQNRKLEQSRFYLDTRVEALENVSPLRVLKRGYTYVHDEDGRAVTLDNAYAGERVTVCFHNGEARCDIIEIAKDEAYGKSGEKADL